ASENVMRLILRIDRELEVETIVDVNVRKSSGFAMLDDLLALDVVLYAFLIEQVGDEADAVGENMQVDVGALADVAGHHAADEPRPKDTQQAHQTQGLQTHGPKVLG